MKQKRSSIFLRVALMILTLVLTIITPSSKAWAQTIEVDNWAELKSALEDGHNVVLTGDPERTTDNEIITVDKVVTLDLHGHSISGGNKRGTIIYVATGGNLTVTDLTEAKNGQIYGAKNNYNIYIKGIGAVTLAAGIIIGPNGVYVAENGCFTMTGGTINTGGGTGVTLYESSSMTISGGTITGNDKGVYNLDDGDSSTASTLTVSGSPVISGNTEDVSLLYVYENNNIVPITIGGALTSQASIGISTDQDADDVKGKAFTSGLEGKGSADNFFLHSSVTDLAIVTIGSELGFAKKATLTANDAGEGKGKWCSYYNSSQKMRAPSGVTAYKAKVNDAKTGVTLTELFTNGGVIKEDQGVLLKADGDIVLITTDDDADGDYDDNELTGSDDDADQGANEGHCYVLSKVGDQFGFFLLQSGVQTKGHRAYLIVSSSGARGFLSFGGDDSATDIRDTKGSGTSVSSDVYTLDGRRLQGEPSKKGVYVRNGQKFIIK